MLPEVRRAAILLREDFGIESEVFSVTSFGQLQREGMAAERKRLRTLVAGNQVDDAKTWVEQCLGDSKAPVIAATDYVRAVPELIRAQIGARYVTLGTDGFGRSDTRVALRRFFEVDCHQVVLTALAALAADGKAEAALVGRAARRYGVSLDEAAPWER
jgi:pyruvate dehydrogenase E1 component